MITIATVAELLVKISGDSSGLRKEIAASQRQLKRGFGSDALDLSSGAAGLLAGLGVAMAGVGVAAVKMSSDFAASKTAFTLLLGSSAAAEQMLSDLTTFAANTPFEFPGLTAATQKLLAFGFSAQDVIPIMSAVGDAISLVGGGQEAIDGVVRALGQIQAKGKLSAEEMNQLSERGINGWKYIADEMGISVADVMALCEKGAIDCTTAINAVVKGMQTNFKGGMDAMAKTVPGLLSTISDNAKTVLRALGDQITESLNLTGLLSNISNSLTQFASVVSGAGIKAAIIDLVPPEVTAAVFALSGAIVAAAIPAMYAFAVATWTAMAPLLPFIAIGAAIGLLAYEIWKNWEPLSELFGSLFSTITELFSQVWAGIVSIISPVLDTIVSVISTAWNSILSVTSTIFSAISPIIKAVALVIGVVLVAAISPVIVAIGLLYAAFVTIADVASLIYNNWDQIGQYFSNLWSGLVTTVTEVWDGIISYISGVVDGIVTFITSAWDTVSSVTSDIFGGVLDFISNTWDSIESYISSAVNWIVDCIDTAWNTAVNTTNEVWSGVTSAIGTAWDNIKRIVEQGINWVLGKLQSLLDLVGSVLPDGIKNFVSTATSGFGKVADAASKLSLFGSGSSFTQTVTTKTDPNTTFTGLHNKSTTPSSSGSSSGSKTSAADKEAKAYEKLQDKAEKVGEAIEKEWLQLTNTQMASLDKWYQDEIKKLDESKSANADYTTDKARLDEIYAAKAAKILQEQQKEANSVWDQAYSDAADYKTRLASLGLTGVMLQKFEIESNGEEEITKIQNAYRDLALKFAGDSNEIKLQSIEAWTESGKAFTLMVNGMEVDAKEFIDKNKNNAAAMKNTSVSFAEETGKQVVLINAETAKKIKDLKFNETKYKEDLDAAYTAGNVAEYQKLYNNHQTAENKSLADHQAYLDAWKEATAAASKSSMQYMLDTITGVSDSMKTFVSDSISGADSLSDTWKALGQNIRKVFADIAASYVSSGLKSLLLSGLSPSSSTGSTSSTGTASSLLTAGATTVSSMTSGSTDTTTSALTNLTTGLTSLGTTTQGVTTALGVYNAVQAVTNATKPVESAATTASTAATAAETTVVVAGTAALTSFTVAVVSATAALAVMAASSTASSGSSILSSVFGFASGGLISGPGTSTSDSIPAMLSNGESVLNARATSRLGANAINALNSGRLPGFATGGLVTGASLDSVSYSNASSSRRYSTNLVAVSGTSSPTVTTYIENVNNNADVDKVSRKIANRVQNALRGR